MNCPSCGKPITIEPDNCVVCGWPESENDAHFDISHPPFSTRHKFVSSITRSAAASIMGKVSSPAKTLAVRENGKKGGRPKKPVAK